MIYLLCTVWYLQDILIFDYLPLSGGYLTTKVKWIIKYPILWYVQNVSQFYDFTQNFLCNTLYIHSIYNGGQLYVSLRLRVQNRRKKWNFPLNFHTMRKLSDLYSGIFQNYWLFNHLDVHLVWTTSETLQIKKSELLNSKVYSKV